MLFGVLLLDEAVDLFDDVGIEMMTTNTMFSEGLSSNKGMSSKEVEAADKSPRISLSFSE